MSEEEYTHLTTKSHVVFREGALGKDVPDSVASLAVRIKTNDPEDTPYRFESVSKDEAIELARYLQRMRSAATRVDGMEDEGLADGLVAALRGGAKTEGGVRLQKKECAALLAAIGKEL